MDQEEKLYATVEERSSKNNTNNRCEHKHKQKHKLSYMFRTLKKEGRFAYYVSFFCSWWYMLCRGGYGWLLVYAWRLLTVIAGVRILGGSGVKEQRVLGLVGVQKW